MGLGLRLVRVGLRHGLGGALTNASAAAKRDTALKAMRLARRMLCGGCMIDDGPKRAVKPGIDSRQVGENEKGSKERLALQDEQ